MYVLHNQAGRITWGGRDIAQYSRTAIRQAVAVVQQNPTLFDGTLRDNIMYGNLTATEEDMLVAAKPVSYTHLTLPTIYSV